MKNLMLALVLAVAACSTSYDYNAVSAGEPEGSARALKAKTSDQYVRTLYADLLGRNPQSVNIAVSVNGQPAFSAQVDEQTSMVGVLDGMGDSLPMRNLIAEGLLYSAEVTLPDKAAVPDARTFIHDQFTKLLGREPTVYELETFANAWASDDNVGPRTVIRAIVGSREYQGH